jgi:class 3 adenylate cyclase
MTSLPTRLAALIVESAIERHSPAYLRIDGDRAIVGRGGALAAYGLEAIELGADAEGHLPFLANLLELGDDAILLPSVELRDERHADIHVVADEGGHWVLLLDRSAEVAERRLAQQLANDVTLMRDELTRGATSDGRIEGSLDRRETAILTAVFDGLGAHAVRLDASDARETIGRYGRCVARPVADEGGVAGDLNGESLVAAFGLVPASGVPAERAVVAATRALALAAELDRARRASGDRVFPLSIGIASGEVVAGAVGRRTLRLEAVVGSCVEEARALALAAKGIGLIVDERSHRALDAATRASFAPVASAGRETRFRWTRSAEARGGRT